MRAQLRTRCGCYKEIEVPHPAPPQIVMPLKLGHSRVLLAESLLLGKPYLIETRDFHLQESCLRPDGFAYYEEV